jgi:DNA-binding XRE family transcriptional regulator
MQRRCGRAVPEHLAAAGVRRFPPRGLARADLSATAKRNNLKAIREAKGLTVAQLADMTGFSRPSISRWENSTRVMSTVHIAKFVEALNVSHSELLDTKAKANGGGRIAVLEAAAHKLCFQIATLPDGVLGKVRG